MKVACLGDLQGLGRAMGCLKGTEEVSWGYHRGAFSVLLEVLEVLWGWGLGGVMEVSWGAFGVFWGLGGH